MSDSNIERFIDVYQILNKDNLVLLTDIYDADIQFIDPLHSIKGLHQLELYFSHLYTNVTSVRFDIEEYAEIENKGFLYWSMTYSHNALKGGHPITVSGHSRLVFKQQKVVFHQDYLDTNSMVFEHIPVIGRLIKYLKRRASQ